MFSTCLGRKVVKVEIETQDRLGNSDEIFSYNREGFIESVMAQGIWISSFLLRFDDGTALEFYPWIDFFNVHAIDKDGNVQMMPFQEYLNAAYDKTEVIGYDACEELKTGDK